MDKIPFLKTQSLTKEFTGHRGAVDINFEINPGEIVGFIGPNGAGKTTTIRMIMGLAKPDNGSFTLFGQTIMNNEDLVPVMPKIGFLPGEVNFYGTLNGKELFAYASELYGTDYSHSAQELARELDLDLKKPFKYMSLGNRKKLGIIQAVMHKPDLVILDEPTSGLDPLIQQKVLGILNGVKNRGGAVFLSSHVLSEVQQICDRIIMIKDAHIILQDNTKDILSNALKIFHILGLSHSIRNEIEKLDGVKKTETIGDESIIYVTEPRPVIELLIKNDRYDFFLERSTLEDMFLEEYKQN